MAPAMKPKVLIWIKKKENCHHHGSSWSEDRQKETSMLLENKLPERKSCFLQSSTMEGLRCQDENELKQEVTKWQANLIMHGSI